MRLMKLKGVFAAALTPLKSNLMIDTRALSSHCLDLLRRGVQGIALFGTTGEGPSFSVKERIGALRKVIQNGVPAEKIILGNGSNGITDTAELGKKAQDLGCCAFLVAPPCYFKGVEEAGVVQFYREVIKRVDLPLILYHIPQFSGVPISLNVIKQLRESVVGLKESEGNLAYLQEVIALAPHLKVFAGKEWQLIEALSLGAAGTICGMANIAPELIVSLMNLKKNPPELEALEKSLEGRSFIPAFKAIMAKQHGKRWLRVRPPLVPALSPIQAL